MYKAKVLIEGSYQELQTSGLDFTKLLKSSTEKAILPNDECKTEKSSTYSNTARSTAYIRQESVLSVASSNEDTKCNDMTTEPVEIAVETRSSRNISFNVYLSYFFAGGHWCKVICLILVCVLTQVFSCGADYWITYW